MPIKPETVRFIKLGEGGKWESSCIEEGTIRLGYNSPYHENCLAGDWEPVRAYWLKYRNGNKRVAASDVNQIRAFYELSENSLWVTFFKRKLYWCFANNQVMQIEDGSRIRHTLEGWSCKDINGNNLTIENLDGRISKVQGFRGTICAVELPQYLENKINSIPQPEIQTAKDNLESLRESVEKLIQGLWWKDFELLVDLIFSQSGWQRLSVLGQTDKDIDLDVFSPVTNRRAFIQVKSQASNEVFDACVASFSTMEQFDEMYFVVHSCDATLRNRIVNRVSIFDTKKLSELVINAGLVSWLIAKRS
ncbi:MAG TPA: restriction endonuclease [Pyrinomonadaceae bacterium]|nr:restriction endonuclease [Pyrinomonadaceae bacterium]